MITRERAMVDGGVTVELLASVLEEHDKRAEQLQKMRDYYDGQHGILKRTKTELSANNKLVTNHAKYITDLASAYLIGSPVGYVDDAQQQALEPVLEAYDRCDIDSVDAELAKHAAIYGLGLEIEYMDDGEQPRPKSAALDPRYGFVVYDDTVAHKPLFGVRTAVKCDKQGRETGKTITVYTDTTEQAYEQRAGTKALDPVGAAQAHPFGGVPLVEYWNNDDERGDFEPVTSLIDAYNTLMSDRVNDKQQLVDAILVLVGMSLGDDEAEVQKTMERVRQYKMLELPDARSGADAKYLIKTLDETETQVLADAIVSDIHKISMVPAMTDEDFAGNVSGVAMRYKLLGLEQLTRTKERWFREGLRSRMRLYANVLDTLGQPRLETDTVQMTFSRGLPVNDLEQSQMIANLRDVVPEEVLLQQLSFISDPQATVAMMDEQRKRAAERQQAAFGGGYMFGAAADRSDSRADDAGEHTA